MSLHVATSLNHRTSLQKKNYNTYSICSTNIMEIQYSAWGQLYGIVYRVGTVLQTNIPEEF